MDRVEKLKNLVLSKDYGKRRITQLPSEWQLDDLSGTIYERKARAFAFILKNMPVVVDDDELLVGSLTYSEGFMPFLTESERAEFKKLYPDRREGGNISHHIGDFQPLIKYGIGHIIKSVEDRLKQEDDETKIGFLKSIVIAYRGFQDFIKRYAILLEEKADKSSGRQKEDLLFVSDICSNIVENAPSDFHEALQLFWFTQIAFMVETSRDSMCLGRYDQMFYDFYMDYVDKHSKQKANELIELSIIKLNDYADIGQDANSMNYGSENVVISGILPDGTDGTNELSYAYLDATEKLGLVNPQVAVRLHKDSPDKLIERVCEMIRNGQSQVAIYNDDTFIPALVKCGYKDEDAREYILGACQDVNIPGKNQICQNMRVSLLDEMLTVFNNTNDSTTFEHLVEMYKKQISGVVKKEVTRNTEYRFNQPKYTAMPFLSGTLNGCIERGKGFIDNGMDYNDQGFYIGAPVNAVNSLAAIKKVVFDDKQATISDIKQAITTNYNDSEDLRCKLYNAPKWGNDDDYVDLIAKDIIEYTLNDIAQYKLGERARALPGIHEVWHVDGGEKIGATPDGRKSGDSLPVTLSPVYGTDNNGPTAVFKSIFKLDNTLVASTSSLNIKFHPSAVSGDIGLEKFKSLIKTFILQGGSQVQINVIDRETLIQAQKYPEKYKNLIVRVWGYSAYFVTLTKEYQDDVIKRTAYR